VSRRAIILAGGKGTRLRPYTVVLPKPLMPIGEYPILEVIIRQLIRAGFDHITLAVNHQARIIQAFFESGERWGIRIDYSVEKEPLGTMGPLTLIRDLPENFLVMNGDVLTDLPYSEFFDQHVESGSIFTISSMRRQHKIDYGVLDTDANGFLSGFREKPQVEYEVSMGVYMLNAAVIDLIPVQQCYGFDNLMLDLLKRGKQPAVKPYDGYWLDIGRPDDYARAIDEFETMKPRFLDE
jgi:NDP-sugar pyrophosphorylase family protein